MKKEDMYKTSKYDYLLVIGIVLISVGTLFSFKKQDSGRQEAMVYKNNILVKEIELPVIGTKYFPLDKADIEIEVQGQSVRISKVSCPLKICQHAGWISSSWQTITCVPNRVLIKIAGVSKDTLCDSVTY
jgi:hypothetical protein